MRVFTSSICTAALAFSSALAFAAQPDSVPLIPREILFGNPERIGVQISPDGERVSFIAPVNDVLNVWVAPLDDLDSAFPITGDDDRGIRQYFWMPNGTHIVYLQDRGGDENWRAYSVNLESGEEVDLTPFEGTRATIVNVSEDSPDVLAIGLNDRDRRYHDVYLINAESGERKLLFENPRFAGVTVDDSMRVRMVSEMNADGSTSYHLVRNDEILPFQTIPYEDAMTTNFAGLDRKGENVFAVDSRGRNLSALTVTNLETGASKVIFEGTKSDVAGAMVNPITSEVEAVATSYLRTEWTVLSPKVAKDLAYLRTLDDGELNVGSRSLDDSKWIVSFRRDNGPTAFFFYDRAAGSARKLFTSSSKLEGLPLATMHPIEVPSRDGLTLTGYLTLPVWSDTDGDATPSEPLPMVLLVHGGPWARDSWGFNPYHQWLANRGYAVLSVNFRGSTGLGKAFVNAGDGEWADSMHNDLLDAVDWAIARGVADKDRVAIMGGSYGGYAALAGMTFTPEVFAAGISIVGPSNLITLLESVPPYWAPMVELFAKRVADKRTPEGRRKLRDMSPLTHVDEIVRPLLIGQGANDPRVKQAESDQIVHAMQKKGLPVTYVLFPDEGHGFAKPENNIAFNSVVEAFLARHIGGRVEPISDEIESSSAIIISKGLLDLPAEEVGWGDAAVGAAPASAPAQGAEFERVAFEDLDPQLQDYAMQMLDQVDTIPVEMLAMVLPDAIRQAKAALNQAPPAEKPLLQYLIGELQDRLDAVKK